MNFSSILLPVLIQISLTLFLFFIMVARKIKALKSGEVDRKKAALDHSAWPDDVLKISNNINNQFQTPVLFYALSFIFYMTQTVSTAVLLLAWFYAISRVVHAIIHVGVNVVKVRFLVFLLGVFSLIAMTVFAFINVPLL